MRVPKYESIANDIIEKIKDGTYKTNTILPSENKMCELYDTSRITVRKAIEQLVLQEYIYKKSGKGSFVCDNIKAEGITKIHSFTEAILHQGKVPSKCVLRKELIRSDEALRLAFGLNDYENVYEIVTIYFADGVPFCYNQTYLPQKYFPKLDLFDLNQHSLYKILETFFGTHPTKAKQKISAVLGETHIYEALNCSEKKPLLKLNAQSYGTIKHEEVLIEIYEAYFLTDILPYYVEKSKYGTHI